MRGNDLLFKMDLVDPSYIEAADRKPINWVRWSSVAACLCIAVIGLFLFLRAPKNGLVVKAVDNIDELSAVYDGTLLAENLLSSDVEDTDIRLSYAAGGDAGDSSTWDSLSVSANYNGEPVSLNCSFNGQTGEYDPSKIFDTVKYGDVTVTIYREESEWGDEYAFYRAVFTYNGAAYDLKIDSKDTESIYNYLRLVLGEAQTSGAKIDEVMGYDICRVEAEDSTPFHVQWHYIAKINGVEKCVGEQFGYNGLEAWSVDLDGDGVTELVCNCTWGADGAQRVYVFRNNGGVIEKGSIYDWSYYEAEFKVDILDAGSIAERYDPDKNVFVVKNYRLEGEDKELTFTGLQHFNFTEHKCNLYNAKMDIGSYMQYFVNYFHEPYVGLDKIEDDDILTLVFRFCFDNRDSFDFVEFDGATQTMYIKGEGLRKTAKLLLGESFDVSEYQGYVDSPNTEEEYSAADDVYIVPTAKDYWGGERYYLEFGADLDIDEGDVVTIVTASVYTENEPAKKIQYTFSNVVDNGCLYYRIARVDPIE